VENIWTLKVGEGVDARMLTFKLTTLSTSDLLCYVNSEAGSEKMNFDKAAKCMNMSISKSFDKTRVFQQSANKFFAKNVRHHLEFSKAHKEDPDIPSHTLEIMLEYHYNVKPGMGNIILNSSLATSAFFRTILANEFLADTKHSKIRVNV
jgi:eukaryotic translation initiation factor 2C